MLILTFLAACSCLINASLTEKVHCQKLWYGSPNSIDCAELLKAVADPNDHYIRYFDEEQVRAGSGLDFPGVVNHYSAQIVQLPAFWSQGTSFRVKQSFLSN